MKKYFGLSTLSRDKALSFNYPKDFDIYICVCQGQQENRVEKIVCDGIILNLISSTDRGLSKSRNAIAKFAQSSSSNVDDIIYFSDDDLSFNSAIDLGKIIDTSFEINIFPMMRGSKRFRAYRDMTKIKAKDILEIAKMSSAELVFKLNVFQQNNFDERLGLGSAHIPRGEECKLCYDIYVSGGSFRMYDVHFAIHPDIITTGENGYTLRENVKLYKYIFGKFQYLLLLKDVAKCILK